MLAIWSKPKEAGLESEEVSVIIHGYSTASFGDGIRPVALVSEVETGIMKYVELRFLRKDLE